MNEVEESKLMAFLSGDAFRYRVSAVVLLGLLFGCGVLTVAMYNQDFTDTALVTVRGPRAGLQMRKGTVVKLNGVDVGRTGSSSLNPDGTVDVQLKLKPEMLKDIPENVDVSLEQLTAFGNKSVALRLPAHPDSAHVEAGDVIDVGHTAVEVNSLFDHLAQVLDTLQPAKVNSTLGAISTALDGQGANLGRTIETLDAYLGKINRDLPGIQRDFDKGASVLNTYAAATPDIMSILANGTVTAKTIAAQRDQISRFLSALENVANHGTGFLAQNSDALVKLLATAAPTSELLAKYSPEYSCFLQGMDKANRIALKEFAAKVAGVTAIVTVMDGGNVPYKYPNNLPNMSADDGPNCYDLPGYDGTYYPTSLLPSKDRGGKFNPDGPAGDQVSLSGEPLALQLFGPLAGGVGQ